MFQNTFERAIGMYFYTLSMIKVCCLVVKLPYKFLFIDMRVFPLKVVFFYVLRRRLLQLQKYHKLERHFLIQRLTRWKNTEIHVCLFKNRSGSQRENLRRIDFSGIYYDVFGQFHVGVYGLEIVLNIRGLYSLTCSFFSFFFISAWCP